MCLHRNRLSYGLNKPSIDIVGKGRGNISTDHKADFEADFFFFAFDGWANIEALPSSSTDPQRFPARVAPLGQV
jgi:hypothetical protein